MELGVSRVRLGYELRDRHGDSIHVRYEIPIVFANNPKGAKHIFIDYTRLPFYLNLLPADFVGLRKHGLIHPEAPVKVPRIRVNYPLLAQEYQQKLESKEFVTRAELARSLGVSRAWISKVMRCLPKS